MKAKNECKRIGVFWAYFCLVYCGLLHIHYGTDTYFNFFNSNVNWQLQVGRYSIYVMAKLFEVLNISLVKWQQFFTLFSFLILAIGSNIFFNLVIKKNNKKIDVCMLVLFICLGIGNVVSTELFLFPEYALYNTLGIFFAFLSLFYYWDKKNIVLSIFMLIVSLGFYQTNIGTFIIVSVLLFWLELKNEKETSFKQFIEFVFIAGLASIINILVKKIFVLSGVAERTERDATLSIASIVNNLKIIGKEQYSILIEGDNFLPKYMMIGLIISMVIILGIVLFKNSEKHYIILLTFIFIAIQYISVYAPHIIAGNVWLSPRTITPVYIFICSLLIMILSGINIEWKKINIVYKSVFFIFMIFNIYGIQGIVQNHIATNKVDQEYAYNIYCEILKYEKENEITIKKIAAVNDEIPRWKNRFIEYYSYNVNERAYINDWSDVELINYVSGNNYKEVSMDEKIYNDKFKGKNWEYYCPEEQLYFQGDTLYWCKY